MEGFLHDPDVVPKHPQLVQHVLSDSAIHRGMMRLGVHSWRFNCLLGAHSKIKNTADHVDLARDRCPTSGGAERHPWRSVPEDHDIW